MSQQLRKAPRVPPGGGGASTGAVSPEPNMHHQVYRSGSTSPMPLMMDGGGDGGRGGSVKDNVETQLDAQGIGVNAVQVGILKAKLTAAQQEVLKLKKDQTEMSEKYITATSKVNEQRVENSALRHKYSDAIKKISANEETQKQLEEALLQERRDHQATRDELNKFKAEFDALAQKTKAGSGVGGTMDARLRSLSPTRDGTSRVTVAEIQDIEKKHNKQTSSLIEQMTDALDRLTLSREEDETTFFVARSAVLSAATDLETKLSHTQNVLGILAESVSHFSEELEDETSRMLLSLINENKELWAQLGRLQFDLEKAQAELANRTKRGDLVPRDQLEYQTKQVSVLEEKLRKAHQTIEVQLRTEKDLEAKMQELLDDRTAFKDKMKIAQDESDTLRRNLAEREKESDDAVLQAKKMQQECTELQQANSHQYNQIVSLTEQIRHIQEEFTTEARSSLRKAQAERDEAIETSNRHHSDLQDTQQQLQTAERELEARTTYFNNYRSTVEEQNARMAEALQDQLSQTKMHYENEIEDLRNDVASRTAELYDSQRLMEAARAESLGARSEIQELQAELSRANAELEQEREQHEKTGKKAKQHIHEFDVLQRRAAAAEAKVRMLEEELSRFESQIKQLEETLDGERERHDGQMEKMHGDWQRSEQARSQLQEDIKVLRNKATEDTNLRQLKDRMERDKDSLMAENVRLHQQYQEVQQQNVDLHQTIANLKTRTGSQLQLQQQLDEFQRRLAELPSLKQQVDEARREAVRAREEADALREERNEMSERLEYFLEESRNAARKDTDLDRVFREASSQVKRLDQQIEEVTQKQQHINTSGHNHSGMSPAPHPQRGAGGAGRNGQSMSPGRTAEQMPWRT